MFDSVVGTLVILMMPVISACYYHFFERRRYAEGKQVKIAAIPGAIYIYRWTQYSTILVAVTSLFCHHWALLQLYTALPIHTSAALVYVGLSVCLVAMALWVWAKVRLGAQYSPCSQSLVANRLVDTGPYAYVRHPIYVAILGWMLGCFMATGSVWIALNIVLLAYCYVTSARAEERALAKELPGYAEYIVRTGGFLPPLGRKSS